MSKNIPQRHITHKSSRILTNMSMLRSFKHSEFRHMWFSMLAMMSGLQMAFVAQGYLAYDLSDSASVLGLIYGAQALPMLLFPLFAGVAADRFGRRTIIQIGQVMTASIALLIAISIYTDLIVWQHLLVMGVIHGVVMAFSLTARQAAIPDLVPKADLENAVALNGALLSITTAAAPGIGGALYALAGPWVVFALVAFLGLISVALSGKLPSLTPPKQSHPAVVQEIIVGLKHIINFPSLKIVILMSLITASLIMPFRFVLPVFVVDVYQKGPAALGLMMTLMGVGAFFGSLILAIKRDGNRGILLLLISGLSGVVLLVIVLIPNYAVGLLLVAILGITDAGRRIPIQGLIMKISEPEYRGRIMSVYMMTFGIVNLMVLPVGFATEHLGGQWVIGFMALLLILISISLTLSKNPLKSLQ
ncbi:MAG: MFS transporter [Chloroflexota bacterium]